MPGTRNTTAEIGRAGGEGGAHATFPALRVERGERDEHGTRRRRDRGAPAIHRIGRAVRTLNLDAQHRGVGLREVDGDARARQGDAGRSHRRRGGGIVRALRGRAVRRLVQVEAEQGDGVVIPVHVARNAVAHACVCVMKSRGMFVVVVPATVSMPVQGQPCQEACVHQPGGLPEMMPPVPPVGPAPPEPPSVPPCPACRRRRLVRAYRRAPVGVPPTPEAPPVPGVPPVPPVPTLHVPVGTHAVPHGSVPPGHEHAPFVHTLPPLQAFPHVPQFVGSPSGFTHAVPRTIRPGQVAVQPRCPRSIGRPAGQTLPQAPQFCGSETRLMQPVPHSDKPGHNCTRHRALPAGSASAPARPQFAGSNARLAQRFPQSVCPPGQFTLSSSSSPPAQSADYTRRTGQQTFPTMRAAQATGSWPPVCHRDPTRTRSESALFRRKPRDG